MYGAVLVADGSIPYKDFFEVMGPMTFFWLASFFKIFGSDLVVARGLLLFTGASIILLIYLLTKKYYEGPFDYLPAIFYMVISLPLWPVNNHHWDSNLFAILAIYLFLNWWNKGGLKYLIYSGFIAGIATCFMQQKGLLLFFCFIALLLVRFRYDRQIEINLITNSLALMLSYAFVGILVIAFFYVNEGLSELIYANFFWPLSQYQIVNRMPYGYGLKELFFPEWLMNLNLLSLLSKILIWVFINLLVL